MFTFSSCETVVKGKIMIKDPLCNDREIIINIVAGSTPLPSSQHNSI